MSMNRRPFCPVVIGFIVPAAAVSLALAASAAAPGEEIATSLQPGDRLEPFQVKDCTGPAAGKTLCYYCRFGLRPVAAVLVRQWSDEAAELIAQIDREVDLRRDARLGAFVVSLGRDTQDEEERLKMLAAKNGLARTPLTISREAPAKLERVFGLSPAANVAVFTWRNGEIKSARVYDNARLSADEIRRVVQDVRALAN
jgi:hypothetical protein